MRRLTAAFAFITAAATGPALAYSPESGLWWNPAESGTGYTIEIQDNMMVVTVYGGAQDGRSKWYTAAGLMQGNALFEADLYGFSGVQPIGGHYGGRPSPEPSYGKLRIVFDPDNNRRATLTWPNGRSIPIQRHEFYFQRSDDAAAAGSNTLRMLGEWQFTIDFSSNPSVTIPYSGDIVVLDKYQYDAQIPAWSYEGCRPDNSTAGNCSAHARQKHDATGYFAAPDQNYPQGAHLILVKDVVLDGQQWFVLYEMVMGTNEGSGQFRLYPRGDDPYRYTAYPVRSFRSASRSFVQEGYGPSKTASQDATPARGLGLLFTSPPAPNKTRQDDARSEYLDVIRALEARLSHQGASE